MKRRVFMALVAGSGLAAASDLAAQETRLPLVGFLRSTTAAPFEHLIRAFRGGLKETGYVEGENVRIEYRFGDNDRSRLPALARELVRDQAAVIVGNSLAAEAARAVTKTVPIVFVTSDDPVQRGLVTNLARPQGNATGFTFFGGGQLGAKRVQLMSELVPSAATIGFLMDPNWPASRSDLADTEAAAKNLGRRLAIAEASAEAALPGAFHRLEQAGAGALIVSGAPGFSSRRRVLIELAQRHKLPAMYDLRDYVAEGGLVSYAAGFAEAYRQAGIYAGKILKGATPGELPVQQPTRIALVVNLRTAKALGLSVPPAILALADEVIE